MKIPEVKSWFT